MQSAISLCSVALVTGFHFLTTDLKLQVTIKERNERKRI